MFPRRSGNGRLRARGVQASLPLGEGLGGPSAPPGQQDGLGGGTPPNFQSRYGPVFCTIFYILLYVQYIFQYYLFTIF